MRFRVGNLKTKSLVFKEDDDTITMYAPAHSHRVHTGDLASASGDASGACVRVVLDVGVGDWVNGSLDVQSAV